ncbi:MAG: hypothetical protein KDC84_01920 [Crocinitomicaceae bacterium]|nr:hypothetical protein [Crocinitomicaceae bacterium]
MESKEFKILFGKIATDNGYCSAFGAWYKFEDEATVIIKLQKSNYGNYFQLLMKFYYSNVFNHSINKMDKELVNHSVSHLTFSEPKDMRDTFDLDVEISSQQRKANLTELFNIHLNVILEKAKTKNGALEMNEREEVYILPGVKNEIINSLHNTGDSYNDI